MKKTNYIICPHCGCEYHVAEIFYPDDLTGKPTEILKDEAGKISWVDDRSQFLTEEYICDKCGKEFKVTADLTFKTEKVENNFDDEYTSTIYENRVTLEEPKN